MCTCGFEIGVDLSNLIDRARCVGACMLLVVICRTVTPLPLSLTLDD